MARVILVLVLAVVVFVLVSNFAPSVIQDILPRAGKSPAAHSEDTTKAAGQSSKPVRKRSAGATTPNDNSSEPTDITSTSTLQPQIRGQDGPASARGAMKAPRPVFSITTDSAILYSTNATAGTVVSRLRKGDVVEPQFLLNSAGQEWMFVSVADQKVSGFLRIDVLGKKQTADQTSR